MNSSDKDVLLLYPKTGAQIINSPHAYLYIGASLKEQGFNPVILDERVDPHFLGRLRDYLSSTKPLFAGLSTMTGFQIANALRIARVVREASPDTPLVWGGVHPSLLPLQTVANEFVDVAVVGEGEQTACEIAAAIRDGSQLGDIPGVVTKDNCSSPDDIKVRPYLDMSTIPPPDWSLVDINNYITGYPVPGNIDLSTSRGCPHNCAFCYNLIYNKRRWRARGPESVLPEVEFMIREHNIKHIGFADDNFCVNKKRVSAICEGIMKMDRKITFDCNVRADHLNEDIVRQLSEAGCNLIFFGVESGSEKILDYLCKEIEIEQFLEAARLTHKYKIRPVFSFMIGTHPETPEDINKSIALAKELKRLNPDAMITDFKIYTPYPGSKMFDESVKLGFKAPDTLEEWSRYTWNNLNLPWIKDRDFILSVSFTSLFANYYDQIRDNKLSAIQKAAMAVLHRTALMRWNHNFFAMPLEWKAVQFMLNKSNL